MNDKKISPLEVLVAAHAETPAVKVTPKPRFIEIEAMPVIESLPDTSQMPLTITNSSLTFNLSMNIDGEAVDRAMEKSAEIAKNIAAMGAAFIGTAMLFGQSKKLGKIKVPLSPKTKLPRL